LKTKILNLIDFNKVDTLLEGFNQSTGFVAAILDLDGNVLSKSGWRQVCTEFHRINSETSKRCTISDTILAGQLAKGEKYHFYKCMNGLIDVAVPIVIKGEHIANLLSGQFFFEEPDELFFKEQAQKYGFDEDRYLNALRKVPIIPEEKVKSSMEFLLNMTQLISEITFQKLEQMELNEALKTSEERYRLVLENSMDAILLTSPDGSIFSANHAACTIFQHSEEEILNLGRNGLVDRYDPRLPVILEERDRTGKAKGEILMLRKDGTRFPVELSSTMYTDHNGMMRTSMIIRDITERKQAEAALRLSEEKFNKAFHNSPDAIILTTISDGKIIDANETFFKLSGYKREFAIGNSSILLNLWNNPDDRLAYVTLLKEQGSVKEFETQFITSSGEVRNFFISGETFRLNDEDCVLGVLRDITERKLAEETLRENEERYRLISDVVSDYIFTSKVDKNGMPGLSWVTGAFERITGYSFDEYIARGGWSAALHPDDIEKDNQDLDELKKNNQVVTDVRTYAKDGRIVWVRVYAHPVWDYQNNELIGIYGGVKDITESKLAENELANSVARLHTLVQTIPDLIWLKDVNGIYLSCNVVFEHFYGAKEADIIGKTDYDFIDRELADFFRENDHKAIALGKPSINEEWITFADDGHTALLETTKTPMYNSSGTLLGVLGIGHDITKRKKAEEALLESELRLSSIYSTVGDIIFHLAVEGMDKYRFISVNQAFIKATGLNEEMVIGKLVTEVIPEPSLSFVLCKYIQAIHEKSVIRWEENSEYPTGLLIGDVSIAPVFDDKGHCTNLVGSVHDITERKQIEVALNESNERLKVILENNPIAIWDWDIKTDKWFATQKYYTMLGYEPESNYPDRTVWLNRIHPDDLENVRIKISNVLNHTDIQYSYEARMLHADGSYRWQTVLGKVIAKDEDGNVSHMIGVRIDTNDRKQAEEDIRILNNELEQRVIERTSQLEAANKELEAFSYSVSHDLRAPLRHINGYVNLLNERYRDGLPEKALHYLETITSAAKQMGILIDDLLQFSRTGRVEVHQTTTDMNVLIKDVLENIKPDIENRKINWSIQELPEVFGDYSLLKQVWLNLIDNAVKYTRNKKSAEISIGSTVNQENIVFFVRDNGVGFDMKYAQKLFGVFQRLHSQSEFEGTGIGLANVQRIIHKHNGQVWFEAKPGIGATFFFSLPKNKEV